MNSESNEINDINNEKYAKYKELYDKHKNEDGLLSEEGVNNILNECGRKTTLKETEDLIKKINRDTENSKINFENFVKLMKAEDIDDIIDIDEEKNKEENNKPKTLTDCQIYLFMLLLLITGSINTIANKMQQNTTSIETKYAGHQKFITFCMFNGELLCLLIYWLKEGRLKKKEKSEALIENNDKDEKKSKKKKPKIWYFLFPAFFDILGSSISSISLSFLPSSIYQMFRGAIIIFTCTFSIIILKSKYYRQHFLGIFIVVIGLVIVGLNAVFNPKPKADSSSEEESESEGSIAFGIFLVVLSQLFSCFLVITEEKILKGYEIPPLKAVGLEGMWGVLCYIVLLFIFYFIRCESWPKMLKEGVCIKDYYTGAIRFENALFAFQQIYESTELKCYLSLYIISIASFNFSGLTISKYASSTSRTVVDTCRTIIVWAFFLTMPFIPEDIKETFSWLQLLGFAIIILGGVIYNEILVIPFCGFGDNTKEAIKKRKEEQKINEEKGEDDNEKDNKVNDTE
jgi:drug/metabolite transporter (DMT)-like permease